MSIVAGDAAHAAGAALKALAHVQLLDLAGEARARAARPAPDKDCQNLMQRQPRPKVKQLPATADDATNTLQMALFANCFAKRWREAARIDDGIIRAVNVLVLLPARDMKSPGAMTALAADCQSADNRLAIVIARVLNGVSAVDMAEQALDLNRTVKLLYRAAEVGGQAPGSALGIPADR
jgi:hypothetical protein